MAKTTEYMTKVALAKTNKNHIIERYQQYESCRMIGETYNISSHTISRMLKEWGIELRKAGWQNIPVGGTKTKIKHKRGYVYIQVPKKSPSFILEMIPNSHLIKPWNHFILEHRYVMAMSLQRALLSNETVHHIDGNKENNKIHNLQLRQGQHGPGVVYLCNECGSHDVSTVEIKDVKKIG